MGFARKAFDKAKARKASARKNGKPVKVNRSEYDPHAERRESKALMTNYRAAA